MELTDEQKSEVAAWVAAGANLSEVQTRIKDEFGVSLTYMDVRFIVLDLDVELRDPATEARKAAAEKAAKEPEDVEPEIPPGKVSVEMDRIVKPGFLVSGNVVFSDGTKATWGLDQMGRLALDAGTPGYRPADDDVEEFQQQLQTVLAQRGM